MAGLEALHWVAKYPEEVQGIIGLDIALPSSYTNLSLYPLVYKGLQIAANLGLSRVFYDVDKQVPALAAGDLTAEEKQVYKALFYRRPLSNVVYEEVMQVKQNAELVSKEKLPERPILLFSSNGQGTGYSQEECTSAGTCWYSANFIVNVAEPAVKELRAVEYLYISARGTLAWRTVKPLSIS